MGRSKCVKGVYGLIFIYLGCVSVWLLQNNSPGRSWLHVLLMSAVLAVLSILLICHLAALHRQKDRLLHHVVYYDPLTNLPNRKMFVRQLTNALKKAQDNNYLVAVILVDLDNFKLFNDAMGHNIGDLVLKEMGQKINNSIRDIDTVSRQGGDEFTLLLDEIVNLDQAKQLMEELHLRIQEPFVVNNVEIYIKASMGAAIYPRDGSDINNLIKYADIAMYNAKEIGKNQVVIYTSEMNKIFLRKVFLDKELRSAIRNEELSLCYQPQVDMVSGRIIGIESLLRWNNPSLGNVKPSELIPMAEINGEIIPVGEWVLANACRQMKAWLDKGYKILKIAVNISPVQFNDEKLVEKVQQILWETGISPQYLELEITEGVAINNEQAVLNKLMALKNIGIRLALDDFGTGYSCLAYLSHYPIETIKIDRSFINSMLHNLDNRVLVEMIITMAHNFHVNVIAEGVDTIEQFKILREYQCDEFQGYLISPPVAADLIVNLLYADNTCYNGLSVS